MTNKAKINVYYKQSLNELKLISHSNKLNIKISLKKKLINGKTK